MGGWIVGQQDGMGGARPGVLINLDQVSAIYEVDGRLADVIMVTSETITLVEPTYDELVERMTTPHTWRVDEVRAAMAADREGEGS